MFAENSTNRQMCNHSCTVFINKIKKVCYEGQSKVGID